jgi:hypothetical protein
VLQSFCTYLTMAARSPTAKQLRVSVKAHDWLSGSV